MSLSIMLRLIRLWLSQPWTASGKISARELCTLPRCWVIFILGRCTTVLSPSCVTVRSTYRVRRSFYSHMGLAVRRPCSLFMSSKDTKWNSFSADHITRPDLTKEQSWARRNTTLGCCTENNYLASVTTLPLVRPTISFQVPFTSQKLTISTADSTK